MDSMTFLGNFYSNRKTKNKHLRENISKHSIKMAKGKNKTRKLLKKYLVKYLKSLISSTANLKPNHNRTKGKVGPFAGMEGPF